MSEPRLSVVCTPIGNLGDLSDRAKQTLTDAAVWIVEDSRVSGKLAQYLGIKRPMKVLNDHSSSGVVEGLVDLIRQTGHVAVLSDGGAPTVSDPGTLLIDACHDADIPIEVIPGPSAVIAALAGSGFFGQRFAFLGFPPRKPGDIKSLFLPFADSPMTLVFFESPFRFNATLLAASAVIGERRYAICRELTKMHEQIYRGTLPELPDEKAVPHKGEVTVVVEGRRSTKSASNFLD